MRHDDRKRHEGSVCAGVQAGVGTAGTMGQAKSVTARILGVPEPTLGNWVRLAAQDKLAGAGAKPVSAEQLELARLKFELARVKMARGI